MAMSSSMRRRSGLTTAEACSWDIEGTSRDEGDPSCSEPHPTPSSSHRRHQLYSTPPQALPRSGFVHGCKADAQLARSRLPAWVKKRKFCADLELRATRCLMRKIDSMSGYFEGEFVAHPAAG